MGVHLVFLGPSGAGKTTLMHGLAETQAKNHIFTIDRPWTNRARRPGEQDKEYVFVNSKEFDKKREDLLFTMNTYGTYEFGLEKPAQLGEKEVRMRVLLPVNALKFRQLVGKPVIFCAINPLEGFSPEDIIRSREPDIAPEDLFTRVAKVETDIKEANQMADVIFANVEPIDIAVETLRDTLENYFEERNL